MTEIDKHLCDLSNVLLLKYPENPLIIIREKTKPNPNSLSVLQLLSPAIILKFTLTQKTITIIMMMTNG
jgi:hypothetical protein